MKIGDNISVMCVEIRKDPLKVRLGFTAPKHIPVDRLKIRKLKELSGWRIDSPSWLVFTKKVAVWLQGAIEAAKATGDDKLAVYEQMLLEAQAVIELGEAA